MFKPKLNQVFRSRWHALWWGAGICMTAYCSVPSDDQTAPQPKPTVAAHHAPQWWEKNPSKG